MSWRWGPLLGLDLETTAKDPLAALPVSFGLAWFDHGKCQRTRYGLVNPDTPIPEETTAIHGITDEMVQAKGGTLDRFVEGITGVLIEASRTEVPLVGMNIRFDLTIIDTLHRMFHGGQGLRDVGWNGYIVDVLVIDRHIDKWRKGGRTLTDLCQHYGVDFQRTHHAVGDVIAAVNVAFALVTKYPWLDKPFLETLYVQQAGWHKQWIREFNEYLVEQGKDQVPEIEANWPLMSDERVSV